MDEIKTQQDMDLFANRLGEAGIPIPANMVFQVNLDVHDFDNIRRGTPFPDIVDVVNYHSSAGITFKVVRH